MLKTTHPLSPQDPTETRERIYFSTWAATCGRGILSHAQNTQRWWHQVNANRETHPGCGQVKTNSTKSRKGPRGPLSSGAHTESRAGGTDCGGRQRTPPHTHTWAAEAQAWPAGPGGLLAWGWEGAGGQQETAAAGASTVGLRGERSKGYSSQEFCLFTTYMNTCSSSSVLREMQIKARPLEPPDTC